MDMDRDKSDDTMLEGFFEAARANPPAPDDAFMARLMADAETAVPATPKIAPEQSRRDPLARLKALFAASGLSGAAALGVWIGFAMPDLVTTVSPATDDVASISSFLAGADLAALSE
jgi:hypothetical protein